MFCRKTKKILGKNFHLKLSLYSLFFFVFLINRKFSQYNITWQFFIWSLNSFARAKSTENAANSFKNVLPFRLHSFTLQIVWRYFLPLLNLYNWHWRRIPHSPIWLMSSGEFRCDLILIPFMFLLFSIIYGFYWRFRAVRLLLDDLSIRHL